MVCCTHGVVCKVGRRQQQKKDTDALKPQKQQQPKKKPSFCACDKTNTEGCIIDENHAEVGKPIPKNEGNTRNALSGALLPLPVPPIRRGIFNYASELIDEGLSPVSFVRLFTKMIVFCLF